MHIRPLPKCGGLLTENVANAYFLRNKILSKSWALYYEFMRCLESKTRHIKIGQKMRSKKIEIIGSLDLPHLA